MHPSLDIFGHKAILMIMRQKMEVRAAGAQNFSLSSLLYFRLPLICDFESYIPPEILFDDVLFVVAGSTRFFGQSAFRTKHFLFKQMIHNAAILYFFNFVL